MTIKKHMEVVLRNKIRKPSGVVHIVVLQESAANDGDEVPVGEMGAVTLTFDTTLPDDFQQDGVQFAFSLETIRPPGVL